MAKVFIGTPAAKRIAQELSYEDLNNIRTIRVMAEAANFELNRRFQVLHYRNGEINPPFLRKSWKLELNEFRQYHWSPNFAILFGSERRLDIMHMTDMCFTEILTPRSDHLGIFIPDGRNFSFDPEIKGDPMNGVILPITWWWDRNFASMDIESIKSLHWGNKEIKDDAKLIILIDGNNDYRAFETVRIIRKQWYSMPICVVSQTDRVNFQSESDEDSTVYVFRGPDIEVSTFVVSTKNEEVLNRMLLDWKKTMNFFDTHQIIAFHFTMIDGSEPENSEQIFSDTFPNIRLNTLRLLDKRSITGVNYQIQTESYFFYGPVYIIIGLRKFD
uniref:Uncharacterized protein n=1 Tax=Onchocerca volvulus TaxID=6282 RepID=A0A8R1TPE1_ONCVO